MAVEHGIVTDVSEGAAWVKTTRSASCAGCASRGSCMSQGSEMIVKTINTVNARVGDRVVVGMKTGAFLRATFMVYLFPVIGLMAAALVGHVAAGHLEMNPSVISAVAGLVGFAAALMVVKRNARTMAAQADYQPRVIRIVGHMAAMLESRDPST